MEVVLIAPLQTLVLSATETVIVTMTVKAISNVSKEATQKQGHLSVVALSSTDGTTVTTQIVKLPGFR